MKLHLPSSLRTALLCAFTLVATLGTSNTYAGGLHSQISIETYTDFGQNMGRYRVNGINPLLAAIRQRDGGVVITYTADHADYVLPHGMISFESQGDNGAYVGIGYNYLATVAHNGCQNGTYTGRYVGNSEAIHYYGVEYRGQMTFCLQPGKEVGGGIDFDHKMTRFNKLVTDVTGSTLYPAFPDGFDYSQMMGNMIYRAGAGSMSLRGLDGSSTSLAGGYAYITGGIMTMTSAVTTNSQCYSYTAGVNMNYTKDGISAADPMPYAIQGGDSGSPIWLWDTDSQSYRYYSASQSCTQWFSQSRGDVNYDWKALTMFDKVVDMDAAADHTVHIKRVVARPDDEEITDAEEVKENPHYTKLHLGTVEAEGLETVKYVGVRSNDDKRLDLWLNVAALKNTDNWYAADNRYYNVGSYTYTDEQGQRITLERPLHIEDLFNDSNLVFSTGSATGNVVMVDDDTDLGIGYLQFSIKADSGLSEANYILKSGGKTDGGKGGEKRDFFVNSAGYVVDKGVSLHVELTNTEWDATAGESGDYYFREWRKLGDGDLYLEGTGDNHIFLNVGGPGKTYLQEKGGYAAYNVFAASGTTVVLANKDGQADTSQIYRDFTFGYTGATLDFNGGGGMDWSFNAAPEASGFTIHSQSEDAYLVNNRENSTFTLTYTDSRADQSFLGSFMDSETGGALKVVFNGGAGSSLNLHSIHTDLTHQTGSGFEVQSGNVILSGTNTMHAMGSQTGRNAERLSLADDWHYADSSTDVLVDDGGIFTLGSHARLTGDVTVKSGGTLEVQEGVYHTMEYAEGGQVLEDVTSDFFRQFYGLKGDVTLDSGSTMRFKFRQGTDAAQLFDHTITGDGNMVMDLGGGILHLSGQNTFSGTKTLSNGGLVADNSTQNLGSTTNNKWQVEASGFIAGKDIAASTMLEHISTSSNGVLALTKDELSPIDLQQKGFSNLFVGALEGTEVHYGTESTTLNTTTVGGKEKWLLGGGGGRLVVDALLNDSTGELVLGNEYTTGTVVLTNIGNQIGHITFGGRVTLEYSDAKALGNAALDLAYTNRVVLLNSSALEGVGKGSQGAVMVDKISGSALSLTAHPDLYLGATQDTTLEAAPVVNAGDGYRFGALDCTLTVDAVLANTQGSRTGLTVDAQTFTGGVVGLAQAATLTGDVTVMGYDTGKTDATTGDITLRLTAQDALKSAASVTLKDGAALDIAGRSQTVSDLATCTGSTITDSSADRTGVLNLNVTKDANLLGTVDVARLVKLGTATLDITEVPNASVNLYDVQEGTLKVTDASKLKTSVTVGGTGNLSLGNGRNTSSIQLRDGGTITAETGTTTLAGPLELEHNARVNLAGTNMTITGQAELGLSDTTIHSTLNTLHLSMNEDIHVRGTLAMEGTGEGKTATLRVSGRMDEETLLREFDHIQVENDTKLTLEQTGQNTSVSYAIHKLSGSGEFAVSSAANSETPTCFVLDGENDFSGTVVVKPSNGDSEHKYKSALVIRNDKALQNAYVELQGGSNDNSVATLAIDTDNAVVKGFKSTTDSYSAIRANLVAGTPESTESLKSTRRATLTVNASDGNSVFKGNVIGGDNGNGISIVKTGANQFTLSGNSVLNDVSVMEGTLAFSVGSLNIKGDITINRGTSLQTNGANDPTLQTGQTLRVIADNGEHEQYAEVKRTITFNDATIEFSGKALSSENVAMSIGQAYGTSAHISFSETSNLKAETQYQLMHSYKQFNPVFDVDASSLTYYNAELISTKRPSEYDGFDFQCVDVVFHLKAGNYIWDGNKSSHSWTGEQFGQTRHTFGNTEVAVFNDQAESTDVSITHTGTVGGMIFDASKNYTVSATSSNKVTTDRLIQSGSGITTIASGVVVNGPVEIRDGELRVKQADTLGQATVITGSGTLGVDCTGGFTTVAALGKADSHIGKLHVYSGTYTAASTMNADVITVDSGAAYSATGNQTVNMVLQGGASPATLNINAATVSGAVVLEGDSALTSNGGNLAAAVSTGNAILNASGNMTMDGAFSGNLTYSGGGTLTVNNAAYRGTLAVQGQGTTVTLAGGKDTEEGMAYASVERVQLGQGTGLVLEKSTNLTGDTAVEMQDRSSITFNCGDNKQPETVARIDVQGGTATLLGADNGGSLQVTGSISGSGTLALLSDNNHGNRWQVASTISDGSDTGDKLAVTIGGNVTVSGNNTYSGGTTINSGAVIAAGTQAFAAGNLAMEGGTLTLNSDLTVTNLNGSGGTINLNTKNLVLNSSADTNNIYTGAMTGNGNLVKLGAGSQAFDSRAAYSNVDVQQGRLALDASEIGYAANIATTGILELRGTELAISRTISNAGTLAFAAEQSLIKLNPGRSFELITEQYKDIAGHITADGNGFAMGGSVKVVEMADGGAIVGGAVTVDLAGDLYTLDKETGYATRSGNSGTYFVRTGTVEYDNTFDPSNVKNFTLNSKEAAAPAELHLAKALEEGVTITSTGFGGVLNIGNEVAVSADMLDAGSALMLKGTGTLALEAGNRSMPGNVYLTDEWEGIVRLTGGTALNSNLTLLGNNKSIVELNGVTGSFKNQWINLRLTDTENGSPALVWTAGNSDASKRGTVVQGGAVSGSGTMTVGSTGNSQNFTFTGDVSGWNGTYVQRGGTSDVTFSHPGDTAVNATFFKQSGTLNINVGDGSASTQATFNGGMQDVNSLNVKTGSTAALGTSTTNSIGNVTVAADASLTNQGTTTVSGTITNDGAITNSGTLDIGQTTNVGIITNTGDLTINKALTGGTITNSGNIYIGSLFEGSVERYIDTKGNKTPTGNGFAIISQIQLGGHIVNNDGHIFYNNQDVTTIVLSGKAFDEAIVNYGTYYAKTGTETYSAIQGAAKGLLEHISLAGSATLTVDTPDEGPVLRSSLLLDNSGSSLVFNGGTMVVDSDVASTISGSNATLQTDAGKPGTMYKVGALGAATINIEGPGGLSAKTVASNSTVNVANGALLSLSDGMALNSASSFNVGGDSTGELAELLLSGSQLASGSKINLNGNGIVRAGSLVLLFNNAGVTATNTGNELAMSAVLSNGDLTMNVAEGGELAFSGGLVSDSMGTDKNHKIIKDGQGKLIIGKADGTSGAQTFRSGIQVTAGTMDVNLNLTLNNTLNQTAGGDVVNVRSGHTFAANGDVLLNTKGMTVEEGATLKLGGKLDITALGTDAPAKVQGNSSAYDTPSSVYTIRDAEIAAHTDSGEIILSNRLENVRLINDGTHVLTENNDANTGKDASERISAEARLGNINFMNKVSGMTVNDLVIRAGKSVGVYTDAAALESQEAALAIAGQLVGYTLSSLNADVTLMSGSLLNVYGTENTGITLGSALTFETGITLSSMDVAAAAGMGGAPYHLFNGVDAFTLAESPYTATTEAITVEDAVDASTYFTNLQKGKFYLVYTGSGMNGANVGQVYLVGATVPEPATSTLSLLALAALAARRRRKQ